MSDSERQTLNEIGDLLNSLQLADEGVVDCEVMLKDTIYDETGAFIRLIVSDDVWTDDWPSEHGLSVIEKIREQFRERGIPYHPYVNVWTESDRRELEPAV